MDDRKKQALERAYARFLEEQAKEEAKLKAAAQREAVAEAQRPQPATIDAPTPKAEPALSEEERARIAAMKYAKYLKENNLKPGDKVSPEAMAEILAEEPAVTTEKNVAEKEEKKNIFKSKVKRDRKPVEELPAFHPRKMLEDIRLTGVMFADFLAWLIDLHDRAQERIDKVLFGMFESLVTEYLGMLDKYKITRRSIGTSVMAVVMMSCLMLLLFDHCTVYEYAYNGRVLGYVDNQESVTDVLGIAGELLSKNNDISIDFKQGDNITFRRVSSVDKTVDTSDEAVNKLAYMTDIEVTAYGVYEDGKLVTILESETSAKNAIDSAKKIQSTPDEGMKLIEADFINDITIQPINVTITSVQSVGSATKQLTEGGSIDIYHIVENDETIKSIASDFGVEEDSVCDADTEKAAKSIEVGDKVLIKKKAEPIQIKMIEDGTMSEVIPYTTVHKNTDTMYKGETAVSVTGVNGKQTITGKVTKINGTVTERDLTKQEVITEKVDEVILVGTAAKPKTAPTGVFGMPIRNYTLTSAYGYRWGRTHQGLDMAAPTGTPIYASDGGTVTISSWQSGYGYCIYIDHGNGYTTRYGHCSKLLVDAGTKVYKGQEIALCGSTGNSTGPHLHFEIRKGGEALDPGPTLGIY